MCTPCHNAYQNGYQKRRVKMRERVSFYRGAEAMRLAAIAAFERTAFTEINGYMAAQQVKDLKVLHSDIRPGPSVETELHGTRI